MICQLQDSISKDNQKIPILKIDFESQNQNLARTAIYIVEIAKPPKNFSGGLNLSLATISLSCQSPAAYTSPFLSTQGIEICWWIRD